MNGKRTPKVHGLKYELDIPARQLRLSCRQPAHGFAPFAGNMDRESDRLNGWLTEYFGEPAVWSENVETGFPDDLESPGPTLISTATLAAVAEWFSLELDEVRQRFRANLEIDGVPAFWEDRLYGSHGGTVSHGSTVPQGSTVPFRIGNLHFQGVNPSQRCVVPTRHPASGQVLEGFAKRFAAKRAEQLPAWAAANRFDHYYRLAVNTRCQGGAGAELLTGDAVEILTSAHGGP